MTAPDEIDWDDEVRLPSRSAEPFARRAHRYGAELRFPGAESAGDEDLRASVRVQLDLPTTERRRERGALTMYGDPERPASTTDAPELARPMASTTTIAFEQRQPRATRGQTCAETAPAYQECGSRSGCRSSDERDLPRTAISTDAGGWPTSATSVPEVVGDLPRGEGEGARSRWRPRRRWCGQRARRILQHAEAAHRDASGHGARERRAAALFANTARRCTTR